MIAEFVEMYGVVSPGMLTVCGVALAIGVRQLYWGTFQERGGPNYIVAVLCLTLLLYEIASLVLYRTHSLETYEVVSRATQGLGAAFYALFIPFLVQRGLAKSGPMVWGLMAVLTGFAIACVVLPGGYTFKEITAIEQMTLPWGEQISRGVGETDPLLYALTAAVYVALIWGLVSTVRLIRTGNRARGVPYAIGLVLFAGFMLNDVFVAMKVYPFMFLSEYGFCVLIGVMSLDLSRDVMEVTHLQSRLVNSEQRYRLLADNVKDVIWTTDLDLNTTFVSPSVSALLGRSVSEFEHWVARQPGSDGAPENVAAELRRRLERMDAAAQPDRSVTLELQVADPADPAKWLELHASYLYDESQAPAGLITTMRDISARKQAEDAVRESSALNRAIIESEPECVKTLDMKGNLIDMNPAGLQYIGADSLEQVAGMCVYDLVTPEHREAFRALNEAVFDGKPGELEFELKSLQGDHRWMHTHAVPLKNANGDVRAHLAVTREVTARKQAEQAILESERSLREAQRIARLGDWHWVPETGAIRWSDEMYSIYGLSPGAERDFQNVRALVLEEDVAQFDEDFRAIEDGKDRESFEFRIRHAEGDIRHLQARAHWSKGAHGGASRVVGTLQDITRRRQAEQALRSAMEFSEGLFVANADGVLVCDPEGKVVDANPALCAMVGLSRDELVGTEIPHPFCASEGRDAYQEAFGKLLVGECLDVELVFARRNGTRIPVLMSPSSLRNANGKFDVHFATIKDLTASKHAEAEQAALETQLAQNQRIESIGRLAGGIAHDFNNMLEVILGHADIALDEAPQDSKATSHLSEIRTAATRSADLTRQLLAFARQQAVVPRVIDLNDAVESILKMLRRLIGEDVTLTWKPGESLWRVEIDPTQIDQILTNLCVNARDAVEAAPNAEIVIRTKNFNVRRDTGERGVGPLPGEYVLLSVEDNGAGIAADVLENVFEPFFTTKEAGVGTGLGLSTVYGIAHQNGGFAQVDSEVGAGSTFRICLPRCEGKVAATATPAATSNSGLGSETVLVVEDEPAILDIAETMLQKLGYSVLTSTTPEDALHLVDSCTEPIDLVLTDVIMPGMNGRDLAAELVSRQPGMKCLFMSGYTADVIDSDILVNGDVAFVQKPFSVQELATKVRRLLDLT